MAWQMLHIDLIGGASTSDVAPDAAAMGELTLVRVDSLEAALAALSSGTVVAVAVASAPGEPLRRCLRAFLAHVGIFPDLAVIIDADPDAEMGATAFALGFDTFVAPSMLDMAFTTLARRANFILSAPPNSDEARQWRLARSLRETDQAAIRAALEGLGPVGGYEACAAFMRAKAMEAIGDYMGAVAAYEAAAKLDSYFRPASISWGESLLMIGKVDIALALFQDLLRSDPFDPEIRALLASAWIEKNDVPAAIEHVDAATNRAPNNSRVLEAQAQVLLCTGKVGEAFKLMDGMSEVGPFFAAKLNDLGIRLSQSGKGKSALALYQKAHRIVRPELRYKVSLNAALACRRLSEWDLSLRYLERCEQEYGGRFPKLDKIREAIATSKSGGKLDDAG